MLYAYNQSTPMSKNNPSPNIAYAWDDINYLVKMKSDTDFLNEHILSQYFNFSDKNDLDATRSGNFRSNLYE